MPKIALHCSAMVKMVPYSETSVKQRGDCVIWTRQHVRVGTGQLVTKQSGSTLLKNLNVMLYVLLQRACKWKHYCKEYKTEKIFIFFEKSSLVCFPELPFMGSLGVQRAFWGGSTSADVVASGEFHRSFDRRLWLYTRSWQPKEKSKVWATLMSHGHGIWA